MSSPDAVHHTADQWNSTAMLLAAAPAPSGREAAWDQALAFLDTGHLDDAHLVASVVVVDTGGSVLFARHRRYPMWGPLGGHLEPDDIDLCATAARELLEEAGLMIQVHPTPIDFRLSNYRCRTVAEPVLHLDVQFVALATSRAPALVASDELTGLRWFGVVDRPSLTPAAAELFDLVGVAASMWR